MTRTGVVNDNLHTEGGVIECKPTTTPPVEPGRGHFYCKTDKKPYFHNDDDVDFDLTKGISQVIQDSDETEDTTINTSYTQLKTLSLVVAQKKYLVHWFLEYGNDSKDRCTFIRIQIEDTITLTEFDHESKPDDWHMPCSGIYFWDNTGGSAGAKAFDLDGYTQSGGTTQVSKYRIVLVEVTE